MVFLKGEVRKLAGQASHAGVQERERVRQGMFGSFGAALFMTGAGSSRAQCTTRLIRGGEQWRLQETGGHTPFT